MTPRQSNPDRTQISATVPTAIKTAVAARAEEEDREVGRIVARAVECYLSLPVDEAERMVRQARNTDPPDEMGG